MAYYKMVIAGQRAVIIERNRMVIELKEEVAQLKICRARQSRENSDLVMEIAAAQLAAAKAREDGRG